MGRHYQRGYLRCAKRKSGSYCWEFLWRENDAAGKRVRRTAVIGTVEQYYTKEEALDAVNGLKMQVNANRNLFSVLFNHAIRYEWLEQGRNPITLVRQSAKRKSAPEVLEPNEILGLLLP